MGSTPRQIVGWSILAGVASAVGGAIGRAVAGQVWFSWLMWVAGLLFCLLGLVVGVRFRRGDASYADWMDQDGPEMIRLLPILGIPIAILGLPFLFTIGAWSVSPQEWPTWAEWLAGWGLAAWAFGGLGILTLMAYRPPRLLIPPWVLAQNPYAPIELWTYRRSLLIGGVAGVILGALSLGFATAGLVYFQRP